MSPLFDTGNRSVRLVAAILGATLFAFVSSRGSAQPAQRVLLRQLYNDLAVEVTTANAGGLHVAAADSARSIALSLLARDLTRWTDSASRVLAARPRRGQPTTHLRAAIEEPGLRSGSLTLSRDLGAEGNSIVLFVADGDLYNVQTALDPAQARALVGALRHAAQTVQQAARAKKPD
jgi:hypothetical protein